MAKEVITVPNGDVLAEEIPRLLEVAKNKEIYLDAKLVQKLEKKFSTVYAGKYNLFLEEESEGVNRVILIRIKLRAYYHKPDNPEGQVLIIA